MKLGILGGTFNPIHFGHLLLAQTAFEQFSLDKILVMPTKNPQYRIISDHISENDRVQMIKLAISDNPNFEFSDMELRRNGPTYTVDTVKQLKEENPLDDIFFIMGADSLFHFESWKSPAEILSNATILVAARDEASLVEIEKQIQYLKQKMKGTIFPLSFPKMDISSHDIRKRLKNQQSIKYMLPSSVEAYIYQKQLYLSKTW